MPATGGSILKQRNPSGIHIQDTNLFFANVPFEELRKCCNNFNNQIGKGGFGEVYKGQRNCNDIAVKRIRGDKRMNKESYLRIINQFIVELQSMHTFPAENILLLLAYSFTEDLSTEPCLVYQVSFMYPMIRQNMNIWPCMSSNSQFMWMGIFIYIPRFKRAGLKCLSFSLSHYEIV